MKRSWLQEKEADYWQKESDYRTKYKYYTKKKLITDPIGMKRIWLLIRKALITEIRIWLPVIVAHRNSN